MPELTAYRKDLKKRIIKCATELFAKHGVRSVKMDDITKHLSVSKRTVYELYDNKEALLCEVVMHHHQQEQKVFEQLSASGGNVMDVLTGIIRLRMDNINEATPSFYRDLMHYPRVVEMMDQQRRQYKVTSKDFIKRGISEGYFLPYANYEMLADLAERIMQSTLAEEHDDIDLHDFFNTMILLFVRSVCTEKGLEILDPFLTELKGE